MNKEIRSYAKRKGVKLWEIAEKLGLKDSNFSKKLRHELDEHETETVMSIIDELAGKQKKGGDFNE